MYKKIDVKINPGNLSAPGVGNLVLVEPDIQAMRTDWPEAEKWKIKTIYRTNKFDLLSLDETKEYKKVPADDPNAYKFYNVDDTVVVRFLDVDKQMPHIKFGVGRSVPAVDLTRLILKGIWNQWEANHMRNCCAVTPSKFQYIGGGDPLIELFDGSDPETGIGYTTNFTMGLISGLFCGEEVIITSYPIMNEDRTAYTIMRYRIFNFNGTELVTPIEIPIYEDNTAYGYTYNRVLFMNSNNGHIWGNPIWNPATETPTYEAVWKNGNKVLGATKVKETDKPDILNLYTQFVSHMYQYTLLGNMEYLYSDSNSCQRQDFPLSPEHPLVTTIYPATVAPWSQETVYEINGYSRRALDETSEKLWTLNANLLFSCSSTPVILGNVLGYHGRGFPGSPDGTFWVVALSGHAPLNLNNDPSLYALASGYFSPYGLSFTSEIIWAQTTEIYINRTGISSTLELVVAGLDPATGSRKWLWNKIAHATDVSPVEDNGILNPLLVYMQAYYDANPPGSIGIPEASGSPVGAYPDASSVAYLTEGELNASNQYSSSDIVTFTYGIVGTGRYQPRGPWPNRDMDTSGGAAAFPYPTYNYFIGTDIYLYPRQTSNYTQLDSFRGFSNLYYTENHNNQFLFTDYFRQEDGNQPSVKCDQDGNSYFAYAVPYRIKLPNGMGTIVTFDYTIAPADPAEYKTWPAIKYLYRSYVTCVDKNGSEVWTQEYTQLAEMTCTTTGLFPFTVDGEDIPAVCSGRSSNSLPIPENIWSVTPIGPGGSSGVHVIIKDALKEENENESFNADHPPTPVVHIRTNDNLTEFIGGYPLDQSGEKLTEDTTFNGVLYFEGARRWYIDGSTILVRGAVDKDNQLNWGYIWYQMQDRKGLLPVKTCLITFGFPISDGEQNFFRVEDITSMPPNPLNLDSFIIAGDYSYWIGNKVVSQEDSEIPINKIYIMRGIPTSDTPFP